MGQLKTHVDFYTRRFPPDPNAPIAPLPLHLHPPPPRSGSASPQIIIITNRKWFCAAEGCFFSLRKEPPDPNAPLPPLPLHLHPPPPPKRLSVDEKKERSESDEFLIQTACRHCLGYFWKNRAISFGVLISALHPCVVCHSRKESVDSKPPSQKKKASDHLKKEGCGIWEFICLSCCIWRISDFSDFTYFTWNTDWL